MEGYVFSSVQADSESGSEYETDSSEELLSSNVGVQYQALKVTDEERLEDYTKAKTYETVRNKYFTPEITKHSISVIITTSPITVVLSDYGIDIDRVIGFKIIKGYFTDVTGSNPIDIEIPEIPYIACVKNVDCKHLIQRVSDYSSGATQYYENKNLFHSIYFTPIKLSTLTITVDTAGGGDMEFEITVLNRTE